MSQSFMKSLAVATVAVSALGMAYLPVSAQSVVAQPPASQAASVQSTENAQWLSMAQIITKIEAAGFKDIREVERERNGYEAKVLDAQGKKVKLYLNPLTGEVVKQKSRD